VTKCIAYWRILGEYKDGTRCPGCKTDEERFAKWVEEFCVEKDKHGNKKVDSDTLREARTAWYAYDVYKYIHDKLVMYKYTTDSKVCEIPKLINCPSTLIRPIVYMRNTKGRKKKFSLNPPKPEMWKAVDLLIERISKMPKPKLSKKDILEIKQRALGKPIPSTIELDVGVIECPLCKKNLIIVERRRGKNVFHHFREAR